MGFKLLDFYKISPPVSWGRGLIRNALSVSSVFVGLPFCLPLPDMAFIMFVV